MKNVIKYGLVSALILSPAGIGGVAYAADIENAKQCVNGVEDTKEAIEENPAIGDKAEAILMEVMELAQQRCDEKNFSAAQELLELARGMVASE